MNTLTQSFRNMRATAATFLSRAAWIHSNEVASGACCLVRNHIQELSPSGITDGLGEHTLCQAQNIQIFDGYVAVVVDQPARNLVMKIAALILDVRVRLLQKLYGLAAAVRAFLSSRHFALRPAKSLLSLAVVARILYFRTVAQNCEVRQTNVHAHRHRAFGQQLRFTFDAEAGVPTSGFALDCQGLNRAFNWAVQFHLNESNTLKPQLGINQLATVAVRGECDAAESGVRLEARESGFLAALAPGKESLERFINSTQHVLTSGEVLKVQITRRANLFKLIRLGKVVDTFTIDAPRITTFLKRAIVQAAGFAKLLCEQDGLRFCRIKAELEGLPMYDCFGQVSRVLFTFLLGKARNGADHTVSSRLHFTTPSGVSTRQLEYAA